MIALSSIASRLGAMVLQPGAQAIAAGALAGALGTGALAAAGALPLSDQAPGTATVALLACPGSGLVVTRIPSGATWLVTARSTDGR